MSNINIKKLKRQVLSHVKLVRFALLSLSLGLCLILGIFAYRIIAGSPVGTYIGYARDFLAPKSDLFLTNSGNINVLIMGKGGAGNDAPDLTDTMILASISTTEKKITLISIPRDIWMDDLKAKINAAYYYGKQKKAGGGLVLAKSTVEEVVGVPIDYAAVIDLSSLKDVIDTIGGISVNVQTGFRDMEYPVAGHEADPCFICRYQTVTFKPGIQTMNGDTALIFVRSRHGDNGEGDDIHREARQQLVINAILKKVLTTQILISPSKINSLINIINENIETDLNISQKITLARFIIDGRKNVKSYTIPSELLDNPPALPKYLNQLVIIPKKGLTDWSDVQKWVKSILN